MKLWLLQQREDVTWPHPIGYDYACGFVVRAATEDEARGYAEEMAGDETRKGHPVWLDPALTDCRELTADGEPGMVLRDAVNG